MRELSRVMEVFSTLIGVHHILLSDTLYVILLYVDYT